MKRIDIIGQTFGRWQVLRNLADQGCVRFVECVCKCGTIRAVRFLDLRHGASLSCGCLRRERTSQANKKHDGRGTPEYGIWKDIRKRCNNPNNENYHLYGGRGIKVCERWDDFTLFLADMGKRPTPNHSIDRYPNKDGDYAPENCRWATPREQANNMRTNRLFTIGNETRTLAEWCRANDMPYATVWMRIDRLGWTPHRALSTPVKSRG